jgi:hypothetical protein
MKKLLVLSALALSLNSSAEPAHIFLVLAIPVVVSTVASLTGNQVQLCKAMGGTYTPAPQGVDVCPGGNWLNLIARPK